jgi:hypothetical protein
MENFRSLKNNENISEDENIQIPMGEGGHLGDFRMSGDEDYRRMLEIIRRSPVGNLTRYLTKSLTAIDLMEACTPAQVIEYLAQIDEMRTSDPMNFGVHPNNQVNVNQWIGRIREVQDLQSKGGHSFVQTVKIMRLAYYLPKGRKMRELLLLLQAVDRTCETTLERVEDLKKDCDWWDDKILWEIIEALSTDGELSEKILRDSHETYIQHHEHTHYIDWRVFCGLFIRMENVQHLAYRSYANHIDSTNLMLIVGDIAFLEEFLYNIVHHYGRDFPEVSMYLENLQGQMRTTRYYSANKHVVILRNIKDFYKCYKHETFEIILELITNYILEEHIVDKDGNINENDDYVGIQLNNSVSLIQQPNLFNKENEENPFEFFDSEVQSEVDSSKVILKTKFSENQINETVSKLETSEKSNKKIDNTDQEVQVEYSTNIIRFQQTSHHVETVPIQNVLQQVPEMQEYQITIVQQRPPPPTTLHPNHTNIAIPTPGIDQGSSNELRNQLPNTIIDSLTTPHPTITSSSITNNNHLPTNIAIPTQRIDQGSSNELRNQFSNTIIASPTNPYPAVTAFNIPFIPFQTYQSETQMLSDMARAHKERTDEAFRQYLQLLNENPFSLIRHDMQNINNSSSQQIGQQIQPLRIENEQQNHDQQEYDDYDQLPEHIKERDRLQEIQRHRNTTINHHMQEKNVDNNRNISLQQTIIQQQ